MNEPRPIGAETTISEIIERHPELRPVLSAKGIDSCCSGPLTLAQVAKARGLALDLLLAELGAAPPAAADGPARAIAPSDSVRAVLARYPATHEVFARHGLLGCGGKAGPDERIDLFASVHRVELARLLSELDLAVRHPRESASPPSPSPAPAANAPEPPAIYRPFLETALWATLTFGATFGAWNLWALHESAEGVPAAHHWAHGGFQIWGFVFLFIAGVSYQVLPRFGGTSLARPRLARATFWIALAALLLGGYGRLGDLLPGTAIFFALGGALQLAAVFFWAFVLAETRRSSRSPSILADRFLAAGTLWWIVAAGFPAAGGLAALVRDAPELAFRWNEASYSAALFGGALAWIQGMYLRTAPAFLGLRPTRELLVRVALVAGSVGALLLVLGSARLGPQIAPRLIDLGLLAVALSTVAFAFGLRPFRGWASRGSREGRDLAAIVRLAFAASLLFAFLASAYAGIDLAGGSLTRLTFDGARHAFTLGFVTLSIFGMAGRILPVFRGVELRWPRLRLWGAVLIAAGLVLREAQVVAVVRFEPWLLTVASFSGFVAAAGVVLASASILGTLRSSPREEAEAAGPREEPVTADSNVARLIAAHPEALPILIEAGFAPLANPILRRTLARAVTLRQACRMHGIDVEELVLRVRGAGRSPSAPDPLPDDVPAAERRVADPEPGLARARAREDA